MRYRNKPVELDAVQWRLFNVDELAEFLGKDEERVYVNASTHQLQIRTSEGILFANDLDYVVRNDKGEMYPVKCERFEAAYEPKNHIEMVQGDSQDASYTDADKPLGEGLGMGSPCQNVDQAGAWVGVCEMTQGVKIPTFRTGASRMMVHRGYSPNSPMFEFKDDPKQLRESELKRKLFWEKPMKRAILKATETRCE